MIKCSLVFSGNMKSIRDWVFSQVISKSVVSYRTLSGNTSFVCEGPPEEELDEQGTPPSLFTAYT